LAIGVCKSCMSFKSGGDRELTAISYQLSARERARLATGSKLGYQTFSAPLLLLLHGSNIDDVLVIGVGAYLVIMFILAQFKARRIRREKLRRKAERTDAHTQTAQAESPEISEEKISTNLEN
jgi:hypothetical protein